jgi:methionyl-tRNA formyltransferase
MKIVFAGSPAIAIPALKSLYDAAADGLCRLSAVISSPDMPKGRSGRPTPSDIAAFAAVMNNENRTKDGPTPQILKPDKLDGEFSRQIAGLEADLLVSFAYGKLFSAEFLSLFRLGGINVHPSLLPKYRGAAPIQQALLNMDVETGITIQRLAAKMDAGAILDARPLPLSGRETGESLSARVAGETPRLLAGVLQKLAAGNIEERPQDESRVSYCGKLTRESGKIRWSDGAPLIDARVRALTPWPLAWTEGGALELAILEAAPLEGESGLAAGTVVSAAKPHGILIQTGAGFLAVTRLQYKTRKALDWRSFLNGTKDFIGSRLI